MDTPDHIIVNSQFGCRLSASLDIENFNAPVLQGRLIVLFSGQKWMNGVTLKVIPDKTEFHKIN